MTLIAKYKINGNENALDKGVVAKPPAKQSKLFSVAAIAAALIFVLINILPIVFAQLFTSSEQKADPNYSYNKLENFVRNSAYEGEKVGPWPWWVARAYFNTPAPNIVTMGDSQINAAFIQADAIAGNKPKDCVSDRDCYALKQSLARLASDKTRNLHLVNLAMGGAMPSDYYLMSKAFFNADHKPDVVILTISPRSFVDATLTSASSTETFQFLSPFVSLDNLVDYAFGNSVEKYFWLIKKQLSVFKYRQDINLSAHSFFEHLLASLYPKTLNPKAEDSVLNGAPVPAIYGGGGSVGLGSNVVVPNPNVPFRGNKKEYEKRFSQLKTQTLSAQSTYFLATLQYLQQLGVKVIVIDMPMLSPVRELLPPSFWRDYSAQLKETCRKTNASWLDLSNDPEFAQKDFLDYVHLNAYGGQKFVDRLAKFIGIYCL